MEQDEFQRALLGSARGDGPTADQQSRAWERFSGSLAAAAGATAVAGAVRAGAQTAATKAFAAKWLLIGALLGSVVTATIFRVAQRDRATHVAPPTQVASATASAQAPASAAPSAVVVAAGAPSVVASAAPLPSHVGSNAHAEKPVVKPTAHPSAPPSTSATESLAAEIAAIDAARADCKSGHYSDALADVAQYRKDHPGGELAREADVVEMEILEAKGDRDELVRAADAFLAAHPNDPHAARVRQFVAH